MCTFSTQNNKYIISLLIALTYNSFIINYFEILSGKTINNKK